MSDPLSPSEGALLLLMRDALQNLTDMLASGPLPTLYVELGPLVVQAQAVLTMDEEGTQALTVLDTLGTMAVMVQVLADWCHQTLEGTVRLPGYPQRTEAEVREVLRALDALRVESADVAQWDDEGGEDGT
jgi:hypothetical protein